MLIYNFKQIGVKLREIRKKNGLTQIAVAEAAGLSERGYADIERGKANARLETILWICEVLHITPDEILTETEPTTTKKEADILARLNACSPKDKETALQILDVYLKSLT